MSKKLNPLEDPPTASSSDDDEVETSAGEEEEEDDASSSEEDDEPLVPVKPPSAAAVTIAVPGKTTAAKEASDSDAGSETETDSDSETEQPLNPQGSGKSVAVTVSAAAAKPKKKEEAQPSVILASPAVKSGTKRPSEGTSRESNSKRAKQVDDEKKIGEDSKKPAFQRLWTEEDEITVLQGMIDFKADTGKSPYEDTNLYYDFIKKSISFEVSKNQFMDKIRSLKKKYMSKGKTAFTKPHDQKSFKLCKYIWGPEGMALESAVKWNGMSKKTKKLDSVKQELSFVSSPNGKTVEEDKRVLTTHGGDSESPVAVKKPDWFENSFLVRSIAGFGVDEYAVKQRWSLVAVENKKKVEEKLKMLQAKEIDFVLEKTQFLHEVTSMIAEASKNKPLDI